MNWIGIFVIRDASILSTKVLVRLDGELGLKPEKANEAQCHHCHHEEEHVLDLHHSLLDLLEFLFHLGISMLLVVVRIWSRTRARLLNGRLVQFFFDVCGTMIQIADRRLQLLHECWLGLLENIVGSRSSPRKGSHSDLLIKRWTLGALHRNRRRWRGRWGGKGA